MFDKALVRRWLTIVYGDVPGLVHICATNAWAGRTFIDLDAAADYVEQLHHEGREGVYARVTTLKGALSPGSRGGEADTLALPALWADIDLAGPGHKGDHQLPPDEAGARAMVALAGLPEPTLWIHSGGGCYPYWLLYPAHQVNDDLDEVADLSAGWQRALGRAAATLGWHYGTGVGDLARVLRIPGTVNRKVGLERPCRLIAASPNRYTLADLYDALAATATAEPEPPEVPRLTSVRADDGSASPGDDFAARIDWADILQPHGWQYAYSRGQTRYWRRPGKDTAGTSATTNYTGTDRLKVFTDATQFEQDASYSKLAAHAVLNHGGDLRAAAKALRDEGFGRPSPLAPDPAMFQRDAIADLIPRGIPASPVVLQAVDGTAARVIAEPAPIPEAYGPTEDGLARALVAHHGHELRYCPQRGRWLMWTGYRWLWDESERHRELVRTLARELPEEKSEWRRFKGRAMSASGVTGVARLAQSDSAITVHLDALDARPYELNTPAGIIDLRSGECGRPDPAAMHTRCTAIAPDFDRRSDVFDRFLADTFGDDEGLVGYVQRLVGLSAIGTVLEQVLPFAHGSGANGKSTLLEAAMHALGTGETGYAMAAAAEMLMVRKHSEHPTELAQLAGARLVVCSELDDGQRFAEARIKQLTGRDSVNARFMRRDPFTFTPSHTLWLLGNHRPAAQAGGPAFWRRVKLLPFSRVVSEQRRDPRLGEKLVEDAAAVLAWIATGAADYHTAGLREPGLVQKATEAYARDQDTVGRWVDDACHLAPGQAIVRVSTADARAGYESWCREAGEESVTPKRFGMELRDRFGVELAKSNGRKFYTGMALLETGSDSPDNDNDAEAARDRGRYR